MELSLYARFRRGAGSPARNSSCAFRLLLFGGTVLNYAKYDVKKGGFKKISVIVKAVRSVRADRGVSDVKALKAVDAVKSIIYETCKSCKGCKSCKSSKSSAKP